MQSVKAAEEEYFDFVQELVFQAYFFPDDSYEIRFLLAELLGYDGREDLPGDKQLDEPATVFYGKRGGYVVRNDRTGDIVQISDRTNPNWIDPLE